jgi:hypothetical protein
MPETTSPSPATPDRPRRRWAEHELGALLARAWLEADAEAPVAEGPVAEAPAAETPAAETPAAEPQPSGSGRAWEVVRVPSEAEGGILAMLVAGDTSPGDSPPGADDGTGSAGEEQAGAGRAALSEMLERLPVEPIARLTPDDVDVEALAPAPPGVWLWGDDDIYPDGSSGSARQRKCAS